MQIHDSAIAAITEAIGPIVLELGHLCRKRTPTDQDRSWAEEFWRRMEPLTAEDQILILGVLQDERSWALAERLCHASEAAAADSAHEALRLAQLAVHLAEGMQGSDSRKHHLLAYCQYFKANALRVGGSLDSAKCAFKLADQIWSQIQGSDLAGLLDASRRLDLKATFLMNDGAVERALALIDEALRDPVSEAAAGRLLLKRARCLEFRANYRQSLDVLEQANARIDRLEDSRLQCVLLFNRAVCLCHLERYSDAEGLLQPVRELVSGRRLDRMRLRWLEGRIWLGLGRREDALAALSEVREHFHTEEIDYDFALVSLELAVLHLEEGRTQLVRELAEEMFWIFERQKVHKEALAALTLFRRAVQLEEARAEWTRRLIKYLYQAQHNPGLRFAA